MKIVKIISNVSLIFGIFFILGAIGSCDYMTEIGKCYPISQLLIRCFIGIICMIPVFVVYDKF